MTLEEFNLGINVLQAGIGRTFDEGQLRAFWMCLEDLTVEQFNHAVKRYLCQVDSGFPSISKLREFAFEQSHGKSPISAEAWGDVLRSVRRHGSYDKLGGLNSLSALSRQALNGIGGWEWACDCGVDNRQTMAAQFRMSYESLSNAEDVTLRLPDEIRPRIRGVDEAVKKIAGSFAITETPSSSSTGGE